MKKVVLYDHDKHLNAEIDVTREAILDRLQPNNTASFFFADIIKLIDLLTHQSKRTKDYRGLTAALAELKTLYHEATKEDD